MVQTSPIKPWVRAGTKKRDGEIERRAFGHKKSTHVSAKDLREMDEVVSRRVPPGLIRREALLRIKKRE